MQEVEVADNSITRVECLRVSFSACLSRKSEIAEEENVEEKKEEGPLVSAS